MEPQCLINKKCKEAKHKSLLFGHDRYICLVISICEKTTDLAT